MAVGMVVHQARAEPHHALEARDRRSSRCSVSSRVSVLRLGLSRHCSVVSTVPEPSPSIAPPSRIQSALAKGRPARLASRSPMSWSPSRSYFPPQPLKPKPCARRALPDAEHDRPGIAQPDVAERLDDHFGERARASRALSAAPSCAATSRTFSPLPPAWIASAKAATSRSAGFKSPSHSSGSLGNPIHTASCGAHSGRRRRQASPARLYRLGDEGKGALSPSFVDPACSWRPRMLPCRGVSGVTNGPIDQIYARRGADGGGRDGAGAGRLCDRPDFPRTSSGPGQHRLSRNSRAPTWTSRCPPGEPAATPSSTLPTACGVSARPTGRDIRCRGRRSTSRPGGSTSRSPAPSTSAMSSTPTSSASAPGISTTATPISMPRRRSCTPTAIAPTTFP